MLKKSIIFVLIILITLSPVYSISLFPKQQANIYSTFKIDKVLYDKQYTAQIYVASITSKVIDGFQITVKYEKSIDTINIYNQLDPYSTKEYTFKVKQLNPKSLEIRSITNNNHKLVFSSPITYTFNGNEQQIQQQPSITTIQQQEPQQLVNNPQYISYTSISKLDNEKNIIYFTKDHISSNRITTKNNGDIEYQANYQPYGNIYTQTGQEKFKFSGKELDSSNLYYFGARYYNSNIGRFTQVDPIFKPTESPYQYANNNPIKYVDPTGKAAEEATPLEMVGYQVGFSATLPLIRGLIRGDSARDIARNTMWGVISGMGSGGVAALAGSHANSNLELLGLGLTNNFFGSIETNAMRNDPPLSELTFDYLTFRAVIKNNRLNVGLQVPRTGDAVEFALTKGNKIDWSRSFSTGIPYFTRTKPGESDLTGSGLYAGQTGYYGGAITIVTDRWNDGPMILRHEFIHYLDSQTVGSIGRGFFGQNTMPDISFHGFNFYGAGDIVGHRSLTGIPFYLHRAAGGEDGPEFYGSDADWMERRAYGFTNSNGRSR